MGKDLSHKNNYITKQVLLLKVKGIRLSTAKLSSE